MIEVQKLIPKVYNQSRDFGIFTGIIQIMLNELDQSSRILEEYHSENVLPYRLAEYPVAKNYFRFLLKNKGDIYSILYSLYISDGGIFSFEIEKLYLKSLGIDLDLEYFDRDLDNLPSEVDKSKLVYYYQVKDGVYLLHINSEDPGSVNQDLLKNLLYYVKPVNTIILIHKI